MNDERYNYDCILPASPDGHVDWIFSNLDRELLCTKSTYFQLTRYARGLSHPICCRKIYACTSLAQSISSAWVMVEFCLFYRQTIWGCTDLSNSCPHLSYICSYLFEKMSQISYWQRLKYFQIEELNESITYLICSFVC